MATFVSSHSLQGLQLLHSMAWPQPFFYFLWTGTSCWNVLVAQVALCEGINTGGDALLRPVDGKTVKPAQLQSAGPFSRTSQTPRRPDPWGFVLDRIKSPFDAVWCFLVVRAVFLAGRHRDTCRWGLQCWLFSWQFGGATFCNCNVFDWLWGSRGQTLKLKEQMWKQWIGGTTFMIELLFARP